MHRLDANLLRRLRVAKTFDDLDSITSLHFDPSGHYLAASCSDNSIRVYDALEGRIRQITHSKVYGAGLIRFTHKDTGVIHTGTAEPTIVRYLSLHDNRYLRYFKGHTGPVVSLEMCPMDDHLLSGAAGDSVRLWDLRSPGCQGAMSVKGHPCLAYDSRGLVFAVAIDTLLKLYDVRKYLGGPFSSWTVSDGRAAEWSGVRFSPDGQDLLLSLKLNTIYLVDSYRGTVRHRIPTPNTASTACCFTPDSAHVMSGCSGKILAWERDGGRQVGIIDGKLAACSHIEFNPRYLMMATASNGLQLWLPGPLEDGDSV